MPRQYDQGWIPYKTIDNKIDICHETKCEIFLWLQLFNNLVCSPSHFFGIHITLCPTFCTQIIFHRYDCHICDICHVWWPTTILETIQSIRAPGVRFDEHVALVCASRSWKPTVVRIAPSSWSCLCSYMWNNNRLFYKGPWDWIWILAEVTDDYF